MKNMLLEVVAFVNKDFPEAIINIAIDYNSADIFIDCLTDKNWEVTLDVRPFGVRIGKIDKSIEVGDFSHFEYSFSDIIEVKKFLLNCKNKGEFGMNV
ncbi:MAG: hypothetical protein IT262_05625 [Saprospiraceae bacterium]|nr:hypothetical protein [Saprospiraceae bacterium]